ncbi:MAG TPA: hypothetical protein VEX18_00525 [Polyangiaceae bacterium]|nr:hypothetical protein [Polyangiaceae bacterium]
MTLIACATGVRQDLVDSDEEGSSGSGGSLTNGGTSGGNPAKAGGSSMSGTGPKAFGGTGTSGGKGGGGAGGAVGQPSGGSGGSASGSGGSASGGKAGSGGSSGSGSGGSGGAPVGPGDCSGTPVWSLGAGTKYAADEKVVATCDGGTPCTQAQPPLEDGKAYEFKCLDQFNCGGVDPGSTNWSDPPWEATKACEE